MASKRWKGSEERWWGRGGGVCKGAGERGAGDLRGERWTVGGAQPRRLLMSPKPPHEPVGWGRHCAVR